MQIQLQPRASGPGNKPHQLRRQGILPLAIVSKDGHTTLVQTDMAEFVFALAKTDGLSRFDATMEGEKGKFSVLVKQIHKEAVSRRPIHALLQVVTDSDIVKAEVSIAVHGEPESVSRNEATMAQLLNVLEVRGRLDSIPGTIDVDASGLSESDKILVSDLKLPEGVEVLSSPDSVVVTTQIARAFVEPTPEDATTSEVEIIGESPASGDSE
ncbi:MAG: 50S ribosomal protein L25 [Fimbriimonadaceae bacterium]|nr:50S ribosomal protein L25 [Fimbriimonadaceae bacterium]